MSIVSFLFQQYNVLILFLQFFEQNSSNKQYLICGQFFLLIGDKVYQAATKKHVSY